MTKSDAVLADLINSVVREFERIEDCLDRLDTRLESIEAKLSVPVDSRFEDGGLWQPVARG